MKKLSCLPFLFILLFNSACAQIDSVSSFSGTLEPVEPLKVKKQSLFNVLNENEVLNATLKTDLSKLEDIKNRQNFWDGEFSFMTAEGVHSAFDVEVRLRGRFRLLRCDFPPLKLKFKKKGLRKKGFKKKYNELKLVTHCKENIEGTEELIFKEYLAYKLYNIINDYSFRVQLVKMKYINSEDGKDVRKGWGVLIEDAQEVADKIGGETTDELAIKDSLFNSNQEGLTSLFQYMIANTDWGNRTNRNVELIQTSNSEVFSVPYDFDFSGFVNAPYASIDRKFGQESLRDRVFLGNAETVEEIQPAIDIFLAKKEEILNELSQFKRLSRKSRADLKGFIKSFYKTLEDTENLQAVLFKKPVDNR